MNKILSLTVAALIALSPVVQAREVSNPTNPDAWSVAGGDCYSGGAVTGCEVAVDFDGNLVPTVTGTQKLGSASLVWLQEWITTVTATTVTATNGNITTVNSTSIVNAATASSLFVIAGSVSGSPFASAVDIIQAGSAQAYFAIAKVGGWAERHGTPPAVTSCGTSPSVVSGNSQTGDVTMGSVPATTCTLTFQSGENPTNIPHCFCTNRTSKVSCIAQPTASTIVLVGTGAGAFANSNDTIDYGCLGHQ